MDEQEWSADWVRGVLPMCALAVVARGPAHGYAVAQHLHQAGMSQVKGGSLYPVLNRLEQDGAVTSAWQEGEGGPGRKVFTVTDAGLARLGMFRSSWGPFLRTVTDLVAEGEPGTVRSAPARHEDDQDRSVGQPQQRQEELR